MNRKTLIIYCSVAALLAIGIGILFYSLFFGESKSEEPYVSISEGISAVPSDAIFLFESDRLEYIENIVEPKGAISSFMELLPEDSPSWEGILSLHYSGKNKVSPLLVVALPQGDDFGLLTTTLTKKCNGLLNKKYGDNIIYKSTVPDISFARCGNFILASPSQVVVESSLRHIENGISVANDALYGSVAGVRHDNRVIHLNHENLGKVFSGIISGDYLKYAGFFRNFARWSTFSIDRQENELSLRGKYNSSSTSSDFAELFLTQNGGKSDIYKLVPNKCRYLYTLNITDINQYLSGYSSYLDARKKKKEYDFLNVVAQRKIESDTTTFTLVKSLEIKQLALFAFDHNEVEKRVLAVKVKNPAVIGTQTDTISDFRYKNYINEVFGPIFIPTSQEKYILRNGWIVIGGESEIEYLYKEYSTEFMFNLEDYLSQTPASEQLSNSSVFSLYVSPNHYADSLSRFFKSPYRERFESKVGKKNFESFILNIDKDGATLTSDIRYIHEDLSTPPVPLRVPEMEENSAIEDNTIVEVFRGPFIVKDFRDGSTNYLEQRDNNYLRLLNSSKKGVWTVPFDTPLCGFVEQIDYLKNNKLQMLFCSGDKLYLLDRLGRKVGKFPISLGREILLGPNVYDFRGTKDYVVVVLHTDNAIAMYNLDGTPYSGWREISLQEKVVTLPEMLTVGNERYWVVRTSYQTLIYNSEGNLVAEFTKKRKLRKDTVVEVVSSKEVAVTTFEGREMILNLQNGSFRKR